MSGSKGITRRHAPPVFTNHDDTALFFTCLVCNTGVSQVPLAATRTCCPRCGTPWAISREQYARYGHEDGVRYAAHLGPLVEDGGKMDAGAIFVALHRRHPSPDWVYLPQVRTTTGYHQGADHSLDSPRFIDAFALNCLPSQGLTRVGYEIKVSRADFTSELMDPRKRAQAYLLCHQFYYAVAPGVYRAEDALAYSRKDGRWEHPIDDAGVLEVHPDGTITELRRARHRAAWPLPDAFIASLMRQYVNARDAGGLWGDGPHPDDEDEDGERAASPTLLRPTIEQPPLMSAVVGE